MEQEMDYSLLINLIKSKFQTQNNFIAKIKMSEPSYYKKIKSKKPFDQDEIFEFCELLDIDFSEINIYFFTAKVRKNLI